MHVNTNYSLPHILLVEDDENILMVYEVFLEDLKIKVSTAQNGMKALELTQKNKFDLIISDISMPEMTGIEFLEKLRLFDKETPFVFISAYAHQKQNFENSKLNVSEFCVKPIRMPTFLNLVTKYLKINSPHNQAPQTPQN